MKLAEFEIQEKVYDRLNGNIDCEIYDATPQNETYPYVEIGDPFSVADTGKCNVFVVTVQLHGWDNGRSKKRITEIMSDCAFAQAITGGIIGGALITLGIFIITLFLAGFYIYHALAWYATAKRLKHKKPWLAWIPFASIALRLQLGGFHWAWVFLVLIPIAGWIALFIILIVAKWRIFKKRKYPGWFSLAVIIPEIGGILYLISIGFLAWGKRK